jgi:DUF4097 and DUF4098 domain-containing protein YvlB
MRRYSFALLALAALLLTDAARAQDRRRAEEWMRHCDESYDHDDGGHFCELRDFTIQPAGTIGVDARPNGGVAFHGWGRAEVKVVAVVQAHARDDAQAQALAKQVRIETGGGRIRAEGPPSARPEWWSVSFEVYVPRQSSLEAVTTNGGVSADSVDGRLDFQATNGGIHLTDVAGDVRAETTNGGVSATLGGSTWKGQGLDLRTTNGSVALTIPRGYNARLETGTTNGGMNIDFPITVQGTIGRRITTRLGAGGPLVRAITTNGGVRIRQQ